MKWRERMALVATQLTIDRAIERTESYIRVLEHRSKHYRSRAKYSALRNIESEWEILSKLRVVHGASIAA